MATNLQEVPADLIRSLGQSVADALGVSVDDLTIKQFLIRKGIPDENLMLKVHDRTGRAKAIILCSSPASPDMALRHAAGARLAHDVLRAELGRHCLLPICNGHFDGRSFAVMPVVEPLRSNRLLRWLQHRRLRTRVLSWLRAVTAQSRHESGSDTAEHFRRAIRCLATFHGMPSAIRSAANDSLRRLDTGAWRPVHVLMHGDLWLGNILIDPTRRDLRYADRFVIIDWPGALWDGYPMYDLVRVSRSFRCSPRYFRDEIRRHVRILSCDLEDARSYLLAALGNIGSHLQYFPRDRYIEMCSASVGFMESSA